MTDAELRALIEAMGAEDIEMLDERGASHCFAAQFRLNGQRLRHEVKFQSADDRAEAIAFLSGFIRPPHE